MGKATQLPSGKYRAQASAIIAGKLTRKSFTAATARKAELAALEWQEKQKKSNLPSEEITLSAAYERYIMAKSKILSPNTVREYKRHAKNYLQSVMPLKLSQLTNENIQAAVNVDAASLSPKSIRNIVGLLSGVLNMFYPSFSLSTTLPKKKKIELYIPTEDEIKKVMAAAEGTEMELPILLAAFGPMRRGEICALTDKEINGCTVTVKQAYALNDKNEWVIKTPKTTAGYRTIEYPEFMLPLLKSVKGKVYNKTPGALTSHFPHILKKAGVNSFRFHDLRHYCVSFLHSQNVPTKYIMARGGWESESIVNNIYNHILTDVDAKMTKEINDKLSQIYVTAHENAHENNKMA